MTEILDIVNENDEVIGQAARNEVKEKGLICRMVFIGFYTPDKRVILQRRSMMKKLAPGKLTSTVSGHVESGMNYNDTAVKEAFEETGVTIDPAKLISLGVTYSVLSDVAMRASYIYPYEGSIDDLKIEENEGAGFEIMTIDEFKQKRTDNPEDLTPFMLSELGTAMINHIENI